ncbi:hypothetical protein AQJ67_10420 [Streptomyces caeruleatus]|uniref:Uncharacterized protein n=1 Tax=Streptomyces caeruleatus TaxID=661399 RepID=A0A124IA61_9ACTN|nr:hypothetical protein AQJ67_10420 [Streptomyces caeruleatus]
MVHSCGHEIPHDLSNRPADRRAGFARWLEARDCTDCWKAARDEDGAGKEEWLAAKRAAEQEAAVAWAKQFEMPQLEGTERARDWGARSRHQLMTGAHTALVVEGSWDEADWAALEEKARSVTRAGWWIDQRDAEGTDVLELLDAATETDRGTENPFR